MRTRIDKYTILGSSIFLLSISNKCWVNAYDVKTKYLPEAKNIAKNEAEKS